MIHFPKLNGRCELVNSLVLPSIFKGECVWCCGSVVTCSSDASKSRKHGRNDFHPKLRPPSVPSEAVNKFERPNLARSSCTIFLHHHNIYIYGAPQQYSLTRFSPGSREVMFHFQGRDGEKAPRERQEFTFRHDPPRPLRFSHPKTSARPLLLSNRETTPEQLRGQTDGDDHAKYLDTDDLTDSDEAEMEVSDSAADDQEPPRKKQGNTNDDASIPKWSNPDPYTALPPPDESQKKKRDVVQLIRKARLAATQTLVQENAVTANADFISFRDDAGESSDDYEPPEGAPTGPSSMRNGNTALGNRKRTHDDEIRAPAPGKRGKAAKAFNQNGSILNEWRPLQQETATPWYKPDDSISGNPSLA